MRTRKCKFEGDEVLMRMKMLTIIRSLVYGQRPPAQT
jgi:hypothetical protein